MKDKILVFDGVCVLCNRWVQFVLRHDEHHQYKFAAMQSGPGRAMLLEHGIDPDDPISFLLLDGDNGYTNTDALIRVLNSFRGRWRWMAAILRLTPRFIRDPLYRWFARNRYRLFGRPDRCLVPPSDLSDRFLS